MADKPFALNVSL